MPIDIISNFQKHLKNTLRIIKDHKAMIENIERKHLVTGAHIDEFSMCPEVRHVEGWLDTL